MFEALVEKHFPAPDRGRVNKILQMSSVQKEFKEIVEEVQVESYLFLSEYHILSIHFLQQETQGRGRGSKRKPMRQAAQKAKRRYKEATSDRESDSDFDASGK